MKDDFAGKIFVIFGATGGLGAAIARAPQLRNSQLLLVGRRQAHLDALAGEIGPHALCAIGDVTSLPDVQSVYDRVMRQFGKVDFVVNASGVDIRKPLSAHAEEEIERTLAVNLRGAILITQVFAPQAPAAAADVVIHIGGFGDGRLAFPFYTADVASRAGLRAFVEAANREMRALNRTTRVAYFGATSADTEAERPFHAIWQEMGVAVEQPERIVNELLNAIRRRQPFHTMGFAARLLAGLNVLSPRLADCLIMDRYSAVLRRHLA